MRFRRKRRHHTRKAGAMRGDWVIGVHENCVQLVPNEECDTTSPATPFGFSLIDSQDLLDKEDKLTVVRTVGELTRTGFFAVSNGATTGGSQDFAAVCTFHEGIYVAGADSSTPATVTTLDPSVGQDVELDSWMWLRHTSLIVSGQIEPGKVVVIGAQFALGDGPTGPHIDLRVKRKLERGQELVYTAKVTVSSITAGGDINFVSTFHVVPHLRMFCKF